MPPRPSQRTGFTLVELLLALAIAGLLVAALSGLVGQALEVRAAVAERNELTRQARFAMGRMVRAVEHARVVLLPLADHPNTDWRENVREETVPPSPPEGSSTHASAVLATTLALSNDLDGDGTPDADDDGDGRIDEDWARGRDRDGAPGIFGVDDDGDGQVDEGGGTNKHDDDEDLGGPDEDPVNGSDDDGDGSVDEDPSADVNGDGCPGVCGVDDDGDGEIDEGDPLDDDEDGRLSEDWLNPVVFYLDNGTLTERTPVPWDEDGNGNIGGRDCLVSPLAENVTRFRVERIAPGLTEAVRVDLTLALSGASGETVTLRTRVRVGSAL
jgi:prepilin-type N-terminal cleavage/methylation domain-containing protein